MLINSNINALVQQGRFVDAFMAYKIAFESNSNLMNFDACSRFMQLALLTKDACIMEETFRMLICGGGCDKNRTGLSVLISFRSRLPKELCYISSTLLLSNITKRLKTTPSFIQCQTILEECVSIMKDCKNVAYIINELSRFFMNEHVVDALALQKYTKDQCVFLCEMLRKWVQWNQLYWTNRYFEKKMQFKDVDTAKSAASVYSLTFSFCNNDKRTETKTRHCNVCHKTGTKSKKTFGKCPHCLGFYFCSRKCENSSFSLHYKSDVCERIREFTT